MLYEQVDETKVDSTLRLKQAQAMLELLSKIAGESDSGSRRSGGMGIRSR
jgi:hypothetical protein